MTFRIRTIAPEEAQGTLKRLYDAAVDRAGKVFNITRAMSLRPDQLRTSMMLYQSTMFQPSGLTRVEREMVAVVVSQSNDCHY